MKRQRIVQLSTDATFANEVLNDPEVLPLVAFDGTTSIDLAPHVGVNGNVLLTTPHGGFLFIRQEPGVYQLHTFFRREGRGSQCLLREQGRKRAEESRTAVCGHSAPAV